MTSQTRNKVRNGDSNGSEGHQNEDSATKKYPIYLPLNCDMVQSWKVKAGDSVRQGETLAVANRKTSSAEGNGTVANNNDSKTSSKPAGHKRPATKTKSLLGMIQAQKATAANKTFQNNTMKSDAIRTAMSNSVTRSKSINSNNASPTAVKIVSPADGLLRLHFSGGGTGTSDKTTKTLLGYIEPCRHPTVIDGLCVVCGKSPTSDGSNKEQPNETVEDASNCASSRETSNHNEKTTPVMDLMSATSTSIETSKPNYLAPPMAVMQSVFSATSAAASSSSSTSAMAPVTVAGGITLNLSTEEAAQITAHNRRKLLNAKKLSLVLDLDHTLVHATGDPRAASEFEARDDVRLILLPNPANGQQPLRHFVKMRPYLKDFLISALEKYEVSIYTAGTRAYALQVARVICRFMTGAQVDEEEYHHWKAYHAEIKQQLSERRTQTKKKKKPVKRSKCRSTMPSHDFSSAGATSDVQLTTCAECNTKKPSVNMLRHPNGFYACEYCVSTSECISCGERKLVDEFSDIRKAELNEGQCLECAPPPPSKENNNDGTGTIGNFNSKTASKASAPSTISTQATSRKKLGFVEGIDGAAGARYCSFCTNEKRRSQFSQKQWRISGWAVCKDCHDLKEVYAHVAKQVASKATICCECIAEKPEDAFLPPAPNTLPVCVDCRMTVSESIVVEKEGNLIKNGDIVKNKDSSLMVRTCGGCSKTRGKAAFADGEWMKSTTNNITDEPKCFVCLTSTLQDVEVARGGAAVKAKSDDDESSLPQSNILLGQYQYLQPTMVNGSVHMEEEEQPPSNAVESTGEKNVDNNVPLFGLSKEGQPEDKNLEETKKQAIKPKSLLKRKAPTNDVEGGAAEKKGRGPQQQKRRVGFSQDLVTSKEFVPHENEHGHGDTDELEKEVAEWETYIKKAEEAETKARELERKLFSNRIVARCDVGDLGRDVKSLKRVFPCGGLSVCYAEVDRVFYLFALL
jgi:hypothetical protein